MNKKMILRAILLLAGIALIALYRLPLSAPDGSENARPDPRAEHENLNGGERAIAEAFAQRRSEVMVESAGVVEKTLADDEKGSRHQRFIVRLGNGHTVLISHNIDLAPRIPLAERDRVEFRGQYEWNERGGVVHWTHHDPRGQRRGGWVRHRGETYQ